MYKFDNKKTPRIFHDLIEKPVHQISYPVFENQFQFEKVLFEYY